MDCDAMCLLMGPATPLLNLIGFLVFSAIWGRDGFIAIRED